MSNVISKPNPNSATPKTKGPTKKEQLVKLLGTKTGADIDTLSDKLGWQQHKTRAAISGLRKAGYEVAGEKPAKGGLSRYRILSAPLNNVAGEVVFHGA